MIEYEGTSSKGWTRCIFLKKNEAKKHVTSPQFLLAAGVKLPAGLETDLVPTMFATQLRMQILVFFQEFFIQKTQILYYM